MGAAVLISLVLALLKSVLEAAKAGGVAQDVIDLIQASIQNLLKVQGTDVTYKQLEGLRVKTEW